MHSKGLTGAFFVRVHSKGLVGSRGWKSGPGTPVEFPVIRPGSRNCGTTGLQKPELEARGWKFLGGANMGDPSAALPSTALRAGGAGWQPQRLREKHARGSPICHSEYRKVAEAVARSSRFLDAGTSAATNRRAGLSGDRGGLRLIACAKRGNPARPPPTRSVGLPGQGRREADCAKLRGTADLLVRS